MAYESVLAFFPLSPAESSLSLLRLPDSSCPSPGGQQHVCHLQINHGGIAWGIKFNIQLTPTSQMSRIMLLNRCDDALQRLCIHSTLFQLLLQVTDLHTGKNKNKRQLGMQKYVTEAQENS
jgi:hypothetical protein